MFGFGEKTPRPCSDRALKIGSALTSLIAASTALEEARTTVPNYTAQWEPEDYYANEQEAYYRACERYEAMISTGSAVYEKGDIVAFEGDFGVVQSYDPLMEFADIRPYADNGRPSEETVSVVGAQNIKLASYKKAMTAVLMRAKVSAGK